jgi:hypothetical protein
MRSKAQFLEMIHRTRPSEFAVQALETQLSREAVGFSETELEELYDALRTLRTQIPNAVQPHTIPREASAQLNVEYRAEGMGGKGRIYAEIEGRQLRDLLESTVLDDAQVHVFTDAGLLSGFQVDNANTLSDRLEPVLTALDALNLEPVDCVEAGLTGAGLSDVLRWVVGSRID